MAWHQTHVVLAQKSTGRWTVDVEKAGEYSFSLRRWPSELGLSIDQAVSPEDAAGHIYADRSGKGVNVGCFYVRMSPVTEASGIVLIGHQEKNVRSLELGKHG